MSTAVPAIRGVKARAVVAPISRPVRNAFAQTPEPVILPRLVLGDSVIDVKPGSRGGQPQ
jgi:hypothetical protein